MIPRDVSRSADMGTSNRKQKDQAAGASDRHSMVKSLIMQFDQPEPKPLPKKSNGPGGVPKPLPPWRGSGTISSRVPHAAVVASEDAAVVAAMPQKEPPSSPSYQSVPSSPSNSLRNSRNGPFVQSSLGKSVSSSLPQTLVEISPHKGGVNSSGSLTQSPSKSCKIAKPNPQHTISGGRVSASRIPSFHPPAQLRSLPKVAQLSSDKITPQRSSAQPAQQVTPQGRRSIPSFERKLSAATSGKMVTELHPAPILDENRRYKHLKAEDGEVTHSKLPLSDSPLVLANGGDTPTACRATLESVGSGHQDLGFVDQAVRFIESPRAGSIGLSQGMAALSKNMSYTILENEDLASMAAAVVRDNTPKPLPNRLNISQISEGGLWSSGGLPSLGATGSDLGDWFLEPPSVVIGLLHPAAGPATPESAAATGSPALAVGPAGRNQTALHPQAQQGTAGPGTPESAAATGAPALAVGPAGHNQTTLYPQAQHGHAGPSVHDGDLMVPEPPSVVVGLLPPQAEQGIARPSAHDNVLMGSVNRWMSGAHHLSLRESLKDEAFDNEVQEPAEKTGRLHVDRLRKASEYLSTSNFSPVHKRSRTETDSLVTLHDDPPGPHADACNPRALTQGSSEFELLGSSSSGGLGNEQVAGSVGQIPLPTTPSHEKAQDVNPGHSSITVGVSAKSNPGVASMHSSMDMGGVPARNCSGVASMHSSMDMGGVPAKNCTGGALVQSSMDTGGVSAGNCAGGASVQSDMNRGWVSARNSAGGASVHNSMDRGGGSARNSAGGAPVRSSIDRAWVSGRDSTGGASERSSTGRASSWNSTRSSIDGQGTGRVASLVKSLNSPSVLSPVSSVSIPPPSHSHVSSVISNLGKQSTSLSHEHSVKSSPDLVAVKAAVIEKEKTESAQGSNTAMGSEHVAALISALSRPAQGSPVSNSTQQGGAALLSEKSSIGSDHVNSVLSAFDKARDEGTPTRVSDVSVPVHPSKLKIQAPSTLGEMSSVGSDHVASNLPTFGKTQNEIMSTQASDMSLPVHTSNLGDVGSSAHPSKLGDVSLPAHPSYLVMRSSVEVEETSATVCGFTTPASAQEAPDVPFSLDPSHASNAATVATPDAPLSRATSGAAQASALAGPGQPISLDPSDPSKVPTLTTLDDSLSCAPGDAEQATTLTGPSRPVCLDPSDSSTLAAPGVSLSCYPRSSTHAEIDNSGNSTLAAPSVSISRDPSSSTQRALDPSDTSTLAGPGQPVSLDPSLTSTLAAPSVPISCDPISTSPLAAPKVSISCDPSSSTQGALDLRDTVTLSVPGERVSRDPPVLSHDPSSSTQGALDPSDTDTLAVPGVSISCNLSSSPQAVDDSVLGMSNATALAVRLDTTAPTVGEVTEEGALGSLRASTLPDLSTRGLEDVSQVPDGLRHISTSRSAHTTVPRLGSFSPAPTEGSLTSALSSPQASKPHTLPFWPSPGKVARRRSKSADSTPRLVSPCPQEGFSRHHNAATLDNVSVAAFRHSLETPSGYSTPFKSRRSTASGCSTHVLTQEDLAAFRQQLRDNIDERLALVRGAYFSAATKALTPRQSQKPGCLQPDTMPITTPIAAADVEASPFEHATLSPPRSEHASLHPPRTEHASLHPSKNENASLHTPRSKNASLHPSRSQTNSCERKCVFHYAITSTPSSASSSGTPAPSAATPALPAADARPSASIERAGGGASPAAARGGVLKTTTTTTTVVQTTTSMVYAVSQRHVARVYGERVARSSVSPVMLNPEAPNPSTPLEPIYSPPEGPAGSPPKDPEAEPSAVPVVLPSEAPVEMTIEEEALVATPNCSAVLPVDVQALSSPRNSAVSPSEEAQVTSPMGSAELPPEGTAVSFPKHSAVSPSEETQMSLAMGSAELPAEGTVVSSPKRSAVILSEEAVLSLPRGSAELPADVQALSSPRNSAVSPSEETQVSPRKSSAELTAEGTAVSFPKHSACSLSEEAAVSPPLAFAELPAEVQALSSPRNSAVSPSEEAHLSLAMGSAELPAEGTAVSPPKRIAVSLSEEAVVSPSMGPAEMPVEVTVASCPEGSVEPSAGTSCAPASEREAILATGLGVVPSDKADASCAPASAREAILATGLDVVPSDKAETSCAAGAETEAISASGLSSVPCATVLAVHLDPCGLGSVPCATALGVHLAPSGEAVAREAAHEPSVVQTVSSAAAQVQELGMAVADASPTLPPTHSLQLSAPELGRLIEEAGELSELPAPSTQGEGDEYGEVSDPAKESLDEESGVVSTPSTERVAEDSGEVSVPSTRGGAGESGQMSAPATQREAKESGVVSTPSTERVAEDSGEVSVPLILGVPGESGQVSAPATEGEAKESDVVSTPSTERAAEDSGEVSAPSKRRVAGESSQMSAPATEREAKESGVVSTPSTERAAEDAGEASVPTTEMVAKESGEAFAPPEMETDMADSSRDASALSSEVAVEVVDVAKELAALPASLVAKSPALASFSTDTALSCASASDVCSKGVEFPLPTLSADSSSTGIQNTSEGMQNACSKEAEFPMPTPAAGTSSTGMQNACSKEAEFPMPTPAADTSITGMQNESEGMQNILDGMQNACSKEAEFPMPTPVADTSSTGMQNTSEGMQNTLEGMQNARPAPDNKIKRPFIPPLSFPTRNDKLGAAQRSLPPPGPEEHATPALEADSAWSALPPPAPNAAAASGPEADASHVAEAASVGSSQESPTLDAPGAHVSGVAVVAGSQGLSTLFAASGRFSASVSDHSSASSQHPAETDRSPPASPSSLQDLPTDGLADPMAWLASFPMQSCPPVVPALSLPAKSIPSVPEVTPPGDAHKLTGDLIPPLSLPARTITSVTEATPPGHAHGRAANVLRSHFLSDVSEEWVATKRVTFAPDVVSPQEKHPSNGGPLGCYHSLFKEQGIQLDFDLEPEPTACGLGTPAVPTARWGLPGMDDLEPELTAGGLGTPAVPMARRGLPDMDDLEPELTAGGLGTPAVPMARWGLPGIDDQEENEDVDDTDLLEAYSQTPVTVLLGPPLTLVQATASGSKLLEEVKLPVVSHDSVADMIRKMGVSSNPPEESARISLEESAPSSIHDPLPRSMDHRELSTHNSQALSVASIDLGMPAPHTRCKDSMALSIPNPQAVTVASIGLSLPDPRERSVVPTSHPLAHFCDLEDEAGEILQVSNGSGSETDEYMSPEAAQEYLSLVHMPPW
eukprot:gene18865-25420_t